MSDFTDFKRILLERRRAFLSSELVVLRNRAIGIQHVSIVLNGGAPPHGLTYESGTADMIKQASLYVTDAAWGASALIRKGWVPRVTKPFRESISNGLKVPNPEWTQFLSLIPAEDQIRMKDPIDGMNKTFLRQAEKTLEEMNWPHDDHILKLPPSTINAALAKVQPLDLDDQEEAAEAKGAPSFDLLEAFRVRGEAIRRELAVGARMEANAAFARASKPEPKDQANDWDQAVHYWTIASCCNELNATMHCNIAAVALLQKEYQEAIDSSAQALKGLLHQINCPDRYLDRRSYALVKFDTGKEPTELPSIPSRVFTQAEQKVHRTIKWKALTRKGRGLSGRCAELLKDLDAVNKEMVQNLRLALELKKQAEEAFKEAYAVDTSDKTPLQDLKKLEAEVTPHLQRLRSDADRRKQARKK